MGVPQKLLRKKSEACLPAHSVVLLLLLHSLARARPGNHTRDDGCSQPWRNIQTRRRESTLAQHSVCAAWV